ncbi:hypothetical protein CMK14_04610 [Candidatus Poribacteria bacterium]|nr:hypothetical protein [Candidatus Poribacteria bacterium]
MTNYQKRLQGELETEAKRLDWLYARMHYYQRQIEVARQKIEQMETCRVADKLVSLPLKGSSVRSSIDPDDRS